jgi:N-acetylglucosamine-6-sulfatase
MTRDERVRVKQWGPEYETDMAIRFLRNEDGNYRDSAQPFALVVSMNPPHMPYKAVPKKYVDLYAGKTADDLLGDRPDLLPADSRLGKYTRNNMPYQYAQMTGVDDQVGRILDALKEGGLADNTIVVFTSDHGDCIGLHGKVSKNNHYEQSMRVPFLIRWPGQIAARRDDLLLSTPDIYPTLLDLMGLTGQIPKSVQGTSYAPLFLGKKMDRPTSQLYGRVEYTNPALGERGVRTHGYTLMIEKKQGQPNRVVLHNNRTDPYQLKNIAEERPEVVKRLIKEELKPWLQRAGDPWKL